MARNRGRADPDLSALWVTMHAAEIMSGISEYTLRRAIGEGLVRHRRPEPGEVGSIERASLQEFAREYRRRPRSTPPTAPPLDGVVALKEAAQRLGLTVGRTSQLLRARENETGKLATHRVGGRVWVEVAVLDQMVRERADEHLTWVSQVEACRLIGCAVSTLQRAVRAGEIERRPDHGRHQPSLSREAVLQWGKLWHAEQSERRARAEAARAARAASGPPSQDRDNGHVWLTPATVAVLLGVTVSWVRHLVTIEAIPAQRGSRDRIWIRRDHAEQIAAARALQRSHDHITPRER